MSMVYDLLVRGLRTIYDKHVKTPPVLDTAEYFPAAQRFVDAWPILRDEALALTEQEKLPLFHELMAEQAEISAKDGLDWRLFILKVYGVKLKRNMAKCPELAKLIASEPDVLTASLSILAPRKHIPRHYGPFRGILRFQLTLSMPLASDGRPAVILAIEDQEYRIDSGECLLWDDTYAHEVWNHSDEQRIALLLDIRRRGMPLGVAILSRIMILIIGLFARFRKLEQA